MLTSSLVANSLSIDDNDKLKEKVDEALAVFNEYVQSQGKDDGGRGEATANGDSEATKP